MKQKCKCLSAYGARADRPEALISTIHMGRQETFIDWQRYRSAMTFGEEIDMPSNFIRSYVFTFL